MADQPRVSNDALAMEGPAIPDCITALHLDVLSNDHEKVRALLKSGEYGVDVRSSTGATSLMIASLYGRTKTFFYLVKKKADLRKHDHQNLTALQYVKGPMTPELVRKYQDVATGEPLEAGRRVMYRFLKTSEHTDRSNQLQRPLASGTQLSRGQSSETNPPSTIFLRSQDGLELIAVQRLANTPVDIDLGRKSSGIIRGKNEACDIYKFAISGWAGVEGDKVLCNKEYSGLVRRICRMYNFKLEGSWLDNRWRGDPAEKRGAYLSCHAEKQLGTWVLVESLSQALGTKEVTVGNVARLKELSPELPSRLRETQIELDHKPRASCINFLNLLRQKAGLIIEWKSRKWFVEGQRPRLRRWDGQLVMGGHSNDDDNMSDELDEDGDVSSVTMDEEENDDAGTATANVDAAASSSPTAVDRRALEPRRKLRRHASDPYRKGRSLIVEPPTNKPPRWPEIYVRPQPPTHFRENLQPKYGFNAANNMPRETSTEYDVDKLNPEKMTPIVVDHNPGDMTYKVRWTDSSYSWVTKADLPNAQEAIDKFKQATGACDAEADEAAEGVESAPESS